MVLTLGFSTIVSSTLACSLTEEVEAMFAELSLLEAR